MQANPSTKRLPRLLNGSGRLREKSFGALSAGVQGEQISAPLPAKRVRGEPSRTMNDVFIRSGEREKTTPLGEVIEQRRQAGSIGPTRFGFFEVVNLEIVLFEQVIKIGTIFPGKLGGLTHVAFGHRQNLNKIIALESVARIFKRP